MTHIKIEARHTGDERWVTAGPDAFAVHVWALVHCDQQLTNGRISKVMAERVAFPVPLERVGLAIQCLLATGLWTEVEGAYEINDYESHALPRDEIESTRKRWAADKRKQRWHSNGNHELCDPRKCRAAAAMSASDTSTESAPESPPESRPLYQTLPNQTRPDRRSGSGSGFGGADADESPGGSPSGRPEGAPTVLTRQLPGHAFKPTGHGSDCEHCPLPGTHPVHTAGGAA